MRMYKTASTLAILASLAFAGAAPALASATSKHLHRHVGAGHMGVSYAAGRAGGRHSVGRRGSGFAALVGDPDSGLGFYPLPPQYRAGAARERQRRAIQYSNDIRYAIASEAIGYDYMFPGGGDGFGHHHGIFDPIDGYGTPFFAGFYN